MWQSCVLRGSQQWPLELYNKFQILWQDTCWSYLLKMRDSLEFVIFLEESIKYPVYTHTHTHTHTHTRLWVYEAFLVDHSSCFSTMSDHFLGDTWRYLQTCHGQDVGWLCCWHWMDGDQACSAAPTQKTSSPWTSVLLRFRNTCQW